MEKAIKKYFPVFALPTLVAFTIGFIVPFIMGIYLSFCEFTTVTDAKFVGLKNYLRVFSDSTFMHALWFTALFTIVSVLTINVFAFVIAMLLTKGIKGTNFFRTVFFMPNLIGGIVLGYIWQILLNGILGHFGRTLTYSSSYGFWGLIILMNWQQVGYMMIIYIAGLQAIPEDMLEAAKIDGASSWKTLWNITIPNIMPSITICTFLSLTNGFKLFDQNLALTGGQPYIIQSDGSAIKTTEMLALNIYNTFYGQNANSRGTAQAKAVLFFILWNAAWVTDRCGEWTAAVDTVTADLDAGGDGGAALGTLDDLWQDVQGYMHIIVSHEDLDEAEALMAQAKALSAQGSTEKLYPVLAQLRHQFRLIAETQQLSPKNIF